MDLILRNALIVTDGMEISGDMAVNKGVVKAVGDLSGFVADELVDCSGKIILPGAIDLGLNLLDGGPGDPESAAGFFRAGRDAALGGVTTMIGALAMEPAENVAETIAVQQEADSARATVDFSYHILLSDWDPKFRISIMEAIQEGVPSFWIARTAMSSRRPAPSLAAELLEILPQESLAIIPPYDAVMCQYYETIPEFVEANFVRIIQAFVEESKAWALIPGISCSASLFALQKARERTDRVAGAATIPHLAFDGVNQAGPRVWPPVRGRYAQQTILRALEQGLLSCLVSDHKPRTMEELKESASSIGAATLPVMVPLLFSQGVCENRISLASLSLCLAADPAKLAGLYPRKGSLQPGSDADFLIIDPEKKIAFPTKQEDDFLDPFAGREFEGCIDAVYLRGARIMSEGEIVSANQGGFLKRSMTMES